VVGDKDVAAAICAGANGAASLPAWGNAPGLGFGHFEV